MAVLDKGLSRLFLLDGIGAHVVYGMGGDPSVWGTERRGLGDGGMGLGGRAVWEGKGRRVRTDRGRG